VITRAHPETIPSSTADDDYTHVTCCDPDVGMCGADLSGGEWQDDSADVECPLCAIADAEALPCGDPYCPDRDGGW
jgi:hypothetical protein